MVVRSDNHRDRSEPKTTMGSCNNDGRLVYISKDMAKELQVMFEKQQMNEKQLELQVELDGMNQRIPVVIEGFGENDGSKCVVIASMTRYIELTMDMRGVTGKLILQSVSGMKVPLESLVNINSVDQTADIIVIDMSKARYRRVRIGRTGLLCHHREPGRSR